MYLTDAQAESYSMHIEPVSQGGEEYVRCKHCGAELLAILGGIGNLTHVAGCSEGDR